jgi:hypothetical protein
MVNVNWDAFIHLPGATTYNFEMLCRHLMHRHYAAYGDFKATANQAGIEFHLKLDSSCALGEAGRWFGWQCRWYDLPPGRAIGVTRKEKIEKAIKTSLQDLPELSDWVLWTRHPLTAGDQEWFYGLQSIAGRMRLTLWNSANVEEHLAGPGELYRATYFDELILAPDNLRDLHQRSVAPVRFRWLPDAHQPIDAERTLQQMLGDSGARAQLSAARSALESANAVLVQRFPTDVPPTLQDSATAFTEFLNIVRNHLTAINNSLEQGDWQTLSERLSSCPRLLPQHHTLIRHLRNAQSPLAMLATNTLDDLRNAIALMTLLDEQLNVRMVAVVADAGNGKTHLAAQITAASTDRPAGIFLQGRQLAAHETLDDLTHKISINGRPCPNIEALLAALDAAGERAHRRLPLIIDGLNEAEDPRVWRNILSSVEPLLSRYPHVLLVCTLRKDFIDECLPRETHQLLIEGFATDRADAIDRYFSHYLIDAADAILPENLLDNPLTLRLFCEVTNPNRTDTVGVEAMPGSLTAVFDRYLEQVADRVAELSPVHFRIYSADVRAALEKIGSTLWERRANAIEFNKLRELIDTDPRWDCSLVRMLEQEGILLRMPIPELPGKNGMVVSYDALAGHLIADAVIATRDSEAIAQWLSAAETVNAFAGDRNDLHPLTEDTFTALAGLLPRRRNQQLWCLVEGELRNRALMLTTALEASYLDGSTVTAIEAMVCSESADHGRLFKALQLLRGAPQHPLNADFLDRTLRQMNVAERDRIWTEWARRRWKELARDLRGLEQNWTTEPLADRRDLLRAKWAMWLLTSTVRDLRDQATRTLYGFGNRRPGELFDLALGSLETNDPYVYERTMAAAYGVVMAHQVPDGDFGVALRHFLSGIRDALIKPDAANPTDDWLVHLYVQGSFYFAAKYYPDTLPEDLPDHTDLKFRPAHPPEPITADNPRHEEVSLTLLMDFENYTVGRLVEDRANYDRNHSRYQQILAEIAGTVWTMGWRSSAFGDIDRAIANDSYPHRDRWGNVERYGKKYGWIGFYAAAGRLQEKGELKPTSERLPDLGIDPSFPYYLPPLPISIPDWAQSAPANIEDWITTGEVVVPPEFLQPTELDGHLGPWINIGGYLETEMQAPGRRVWGLLNAILVDKSDAVNVVKRFTAEEYPGRDWIPEPPSDYYTFAGEIPWHPTFAHIHEDDEFYDPYRMRLRLADGITVPVEVTAHNFNWESYHSVQNGVHNALVPSKEISSALNLRTGAQSFHQFDPSGTAASLSYGPPPRMNGHLLYMRRELLQEYAQGRDLVLLWWGERHPRPFPSDRPEWLGSIWRTHKQVWRIVRHINLDGD